MRFLEEGGTPPIEPGYGGGGEDFDPGGEEGGAGGEQDEN